jgi:hypothetical protein
MTGHAVVVAGGGPTGLMLVGELLASLVLPPWTTAGLAGWAPLLGLGLTAGQPGPPGNLTRI